MDIKTKYAGLNSLLFMWQKVKTALAGKVDAEQGKGLSSNDFTGDYKGKLDGIEVGANKTMVDDVLSSTSTNPIQNKAVNAAIAAAIAEVSGLTGISYAIVEALPDAGNAGTIYLVPGSSTASHDIYVEYIWINNGFERIGTTDVELSEYVKREEFVEITNEEIDAIFEL